MKNFVYFFGLIGVYLFVPGFWHLIGLILGRDVAVSLLGEAGFIKAFGASLLGAIVFNGGVTYLLWKNRTKILDNILFVCVLFGFFIYMRVSKKRIKLPKNMFPFLLLFSPIELFAGDGYYLNNDFYLQLWFSVALLGLFVLIIWYLIGGDTFGPIRFFAGIAYALSLSVSMILGFFDLFLPVPNHWYLVFFVSVIFLFLLGSILSLRLTNKKEDEDDIYGNRDNIGRC